MRIWYKSEHVSDRLIHNSVSKEQWESERQTDTEKFLTLLCEGNCKALLLILYTEYTQRANIAVIYDLVKVKGKGI